MDYQSTTPYELRDELKEIGRWVKALTHVINCGIFRKCIFVYFLKKDLYESRNVCLFKLAQIDMTKLYFAKLYWLFSFMPWLPNSGIMHQSPGLNFNFSLAAAKYGGFLKWDSHQDCVLGKWKRYRNDYDFDYIKLHLWRSSWSNNTHY